MKKYIVLKECFGHYGLGHKQKGEIVFINEKENPHKHLFKLVERSEDMILKEEKSCAEDYRNTIGINNVDKVTKLSKDIPEPEKPSTVDEITKPKKKTAKKK